MSRSNVFAIWLLAVGPFAHCLVADDVVDEAAKFIGKPYVWGCKDPNGTYWNGTQFLPCNGGLDCTGLVQYSYDKVGVKLTAFQQYLPPNPVTILTDFRCAKPTSCTLQELLSYGILQRGDLLWFDTRTNKEGYDTAHKVTGHVGIYDSGTTMINALSEKYGIRDDDLVNAQLPDSHYWIERFMFAARVQTQYVIASVSGSYDTDSIVGSFCFPAPVGCNQPTALAASWTSTESYQNVAVSADFGYDGGGPVTAYLSNAIGPEATLANVLATVSVPANPAGARGLRTLFTGLTLGPGTYYLVLTSSSGTTWAGTNNPTTITGEGVSFVIYYRAQNATAYTGLFFPNLTTAPIFSVIGAPIVPPPVY